MIFCERKTNYQIYLVSKQFCKYLHLAFRDDSALHETACNIEIAVNRSKLIPPSLLKKRDQYVILYYVEYVRRTTLMLV